MNRVESPVWAHTKDPGSTVHKIVPRLGGEERTDCGLLVSWIGTDLRRARLGWTGLVDELADPTRCEECHWGEPQPAADLAEPIVWATLNRLHITFHRLLETGPNGAQQIDCGRLVAWLKDGERVERGWFGPLSEMREPMRCTKCRWTDGPEGR